MHDLGKRRQETVGERANWKRWLEDGRYVLEMVGGGIDCCIIKIM